MSKFISRYQTRLLAVLAVFGFAAIAAQAQTVITGPNITTSTWSPAGNPYIVAANCTVPSGNTLTIQPGTIVWMGEGVSLTGNGIIQAAGTSGQRIAFQAISGGGNWDTIIVNNTIGTNQFAFCDFSGATSTLDFRGASHNEIMYCTFSNATTAVYFRDNCVNSLMFCEIKNVINGIWMTVSAKHLSQTTTILNSRLENCATYAIYGDAQGTSYSNNYGQHAYLHASMKNCQVLNCGEGGRFIIGGGSSLYIDGIGYGYLQFYNNEFTNMTNAVLRLLKNNDYASGQVTFDNNTIVGANNGITSQNPWDATIQNNIFDGCASAVTRSGSLSATVSYNDFFGNTANFTGYPVTYGQVLLTNRNGTPSDVLYNIFQNPLFVSASDLQLQAGSPCIDAGEGSAVNFDSYFPPSMGGTYNDIGAYGGSGAGRWLDVAPYEPYVVPVAAIDLYVGVTVNPPSPGHYRLEYSTDLLDPNSWSQLTNMDLTTEPVIYYELPSESQRFYRAVQQ